MKRFLIAVLGYTCIAFGGFCEDDVELPGYRATYPEQMLDIEYLSTTAKSKENTLFVFSDAVTSLNKIIHKKDQANFSLTGGFRCVHMHLAHHLRPERIPYAMLGSSVEYAGVARWKWGVDLSIQPDIRWFDLLRTTRYIGTLHGRYEQTKTLGYHVGAYVETGMRATTVQPIIGIDYLKGAWQYQAIFPIKAGISYVGLPHHIFSLMVRSLYTAVKLENGFHHHPAVALYKATGAELRWDLSPNSMWLFWISIGSTLRSSFQVGNKNFHHKKLIPLGQAPYAQVGINIAI